MIAANRADEAIRDLLDLRITRYPHFVLLSRVWQLRHNLTAYDAAYVVLAETLGALLLTRDSRLASASGHRAAVEVVCSQRLQELDDGILLGAFQFFKLLGDMAGLAAVSRDRFEKC
jgi:hypothetical protein